MRMLIISDEMRKTFEARLEKYHRFKKGPKACQFAGAPVLIKVNQASDPQWVAYGVAADGADGRGLDLNETGWIAVQELFFWPGFHPNQGWHSLAMTREEWLSWAGAALENGYVGAVKYERTAPKVA